MYLVLTEKPDQAKEINKLLKNSKKEGMAFIGKFYNTDIVVLPLRGHIIQIPSDLSFQSDEFDVKDWSKGFDKLPYYPSENEFYKREVHVRNIYNEAKKWIAKCDKIIVATDPDIEGAALGYEVLMFNKALNKVVSYIDMNNIILIDKLLKDAIDGKKSHLDFETMAYQGLIRADFNYGIGINISRYLIVKTSTKDAKTKTTFGTQQTRLLNEITKRTVEYFTFKKKPYYTVLLNTNYGDFVLKLSNEEDKFNLDKIKDIAEQIDKIKFIKIYSVERKEKEEKSLKWYDGSDVAQEASSKLKISPLNLLDEKNGLLEHLYLKKIMTYPRGEAKGKMPLSQLELQKEIAKKFAPLMNADININLVKKDLWYKDGTVQVNHTPYTIASPDIDINSLSKDEKVVFDIVLKRLLSVFMPNPVNLHTVIKGKVGNFEVELTEISDIKRGWKDIYNIPKKECKTKELKKDDEIKINKVLIKKDITKPKPLYTLKSIISFMKAKKIGTQATYKALIETITSKDRPYIVIEKSKLIATKYAETFLKIIPDEAVNVLNEFEETVMNELANKKITLNEARRKRNELIQKTFDIIKKEIDKKENLEMLQNSLDKKDLKVIGKCPKCGGNLIDKNNKYVCENVKWEKEGEKWKNIGKCDFSLPKVIETEKIKVSFTKKNIQDLITKNKTKVNIFFKNKKEKRKKDIYWIW